MSLQVETEKFSGPPSLVPSEPWLSVIIPVHYGAPLLEDALASIAAERPDGVEVLIFNSAEDDCAARLIADRYADRIAISWYDRPDLPNWTYKANAGAEIARAPYITILCHDDFWLPGHLASLRRTLELYPAVTLSAAPSRFCGPDGKLLGLWGLPGRTGLVSSADFGAIQLVQCTVAINCVVMRRDVFLATGGFDVTLWQTADWDLYLKMAKKGPVAVRSEVTTAYRVHGGAQTFNSRRDLIEYRRQLDTVVERHFEDFAISGSAHSRRVRAAIAVNYALAEAASGKVRGFFWLLRELVTLSPRQLLRLLDETRLIDRIRPRLRLALSGGL